MTKAKIAGLAFATVVVLLAGAAGYRTLRGPRPVAATPSAITPPATPAAAGAPMTPETYQGFLYGRITTIDGATHTGRLRLAGAEEAFWSDYFNGAKHENRWLAEVPEAQRTERHPVEIFGIKIAERVRPIDVRRQLTARFGEITRIEAVGVNGVRVTLKSGTVYDLDRFEASDFDDDVRVWDGEGRAVDFDSLQIRSIELLETPALSGVPSRLHGTVRTRQGDFTGFLAWNRDDSVGTDTLDGRTAEGEVSLPFDSIRSIERRSGGSAVTLLDGREVVLSDAGEAGDGNRGIYVDDPRYGRVLILWGAFERIDFSPGDSGPAYDDFPPGSPLKGSVTTRDGRHLAGRLVYDLDESETTETLDASIKGVDFAIPFGLVASIVPPGHDGPGALHAQVTLQGGGALQLDRTGDLGGRNAGILIFVDGGQRPEYVRWTDVGQVDFDRPPAMYPPTGPR